MICRLESSKEVYESQAMQLQKMIPEQPERAKVLAITSGKGGVGKTNIAANISICLAAPNKKVALVDADLGLGNLDIIMNVNGRYDISDVLMGAKTLNDIIEVGPSGVELLCGGSGLQELANLSPFHRKRFINELDEFQNNHDFVVIDTAPGLSESTIAFCHAADHTLVVTTPEPTSITDAYAMIKILSGRGYQGRISLVVNMANSMHEGKKIYRQISEVATRFLQRTVYDAGVLCRDEKLAMSVRKRVPVVLSYPKSPIASSLVSMAARLSRAAAAKNTKVGFFRKAANWFF